MTRKLFPVFALAALFAAAPARAQFLGYASPQTVTKQVLNNAAFACDGTNNAYPVDNLGQSQHYVAYRFLSGPGQNIAIGVQGSMDGVNWLTISDVASNQPTGAVSGSGYYPVVRVSVLCTGGGTVNIAVNYSGTSVANGISAGVNDFGAYQKVLWQLAPGGTGVSDEITPTPYGNTSGVIFIVYHSGAGPGGSTIAVTCNTPSGAVTVLAATAVATTADTTQTFPVPALPCSDATATYAPGGASASTISASYLFAKPGAAPIAGGAATNVFVTNFPAVQTVTGNKTNNNAAPGATNLGVLPGIANAAAPTYTEGDQVLLSTDLNGALRVTSSAPASTDPCQAGTKVYLSQQFTANTQIISGTSAKKIYMCSWSVVVGAATNVAVVEGTGSTCGTGTAAFPGMTGGTTAATGLNFSANGGFAQGVGLAAVAGEATNADNVCVLISAANQTNVNMSYVVQ